MDVKVEVEVEVDVEVEVEAEVEGSFRFQLYQVLQNFALSARPAYQQGG